MPCYLSRKKLSTHAIVEIFGYGEIKIIQSFLKIIKLHLPCNVYTTHPGTGYILSKLIKNAKAICNLE